MTCVGFSATGLPKHAVNSCLKFRLMALLGGDNSRVWLQEEGMAEKTPEVVIIGGGFGGLYAALALNTAPVNVTLLDRRNFHLFQPLLYQVATGGLSPANIAAPLRSVLKRHRNVEVLLAEVTDFDVAGRRALLRGGEILYDTLVAAAGARHQYS